MQTVAYRFWSTRIVTFALAALAAASVAYWCLKVWRSGSADTTVAVAAPSMQMPMPAKTLASALGGALPAALLASAQVQPAASRFVLMGVLSVQSRTGAALIAIDGQEARPVRVGGPVGESLVLQSVTGRRAVLAPRQGSGANVTLELPAPVQ